MLYKKIAGSFFITCLVFLFFLPQQGYTQGASGCYTATYPEPIQIPLNELDNEVDIVLEDSTIYDVQFVVTAIETYQTDLSLNIDQLVPIDLNLDEYIDSIVGLSSQAGEIVTGVFAAPASDAATMDTLIIEWIDWNTVNSGTVTICDVQITRQEVQPIVDPLISSAPDTLLRDEPPVEICTIQHIAPGWEKFFPIGTEASFYADDTLVISGEVDGAKMEIQFTDPTSLPPTGLPISEEGEDISQWFYYPHMDTLYTGEGSEPFRDTIFVGSQIGVGAWPRYSENLALISLPYEAPPTIENVDTVLELEQQGALMMSLDCRPADEPNPTPAPVPDETPLPIETPTLDEARAPTPTPQPAIIGDKVWLDTNQNGTQDEGEPSLSNVTVQLWLANEDGTLDQIISTTTSDENGLYQFVNLDPNVHYVVEFIPTAEQTFTNAKSGTNDVDSDVYPDTGMTSLIMLAAGEESLTVDAGLVDPRGPDDPTEPVTSTAEITSTVAITTINSRIGDRVWKDVDRDGLQDENEPGIAGVSVQLWQADESGIQQTLLMTTTTDDSGNYLFIDIPADLEGAERYLLQFEASEDLAFTLPLVGDDPILDSDVSPDSGLTAAFALTTEEALLHIDAGLFHPFATLGDRVFEDLNGDGLQDEGELGLDGIQVILWADDDGDAVADTALDTTVTTNGGLYTFTQLSPKMSYMLGFTTPAGRVFAPADQGEDDTIDSDVIPETGFTQPIILDAGESVTAYDAGLLAIEAEAGTASIGDRIWIDLNGNKKQDPNEPGIPDIVLSLFDLDDNLVVTALTDGNGNYLFSNLVAGDYKILIHPDTLPEGLQATFDGDGLDTPNQIEVTLDADEFNDGQDFGYQLLPAEVSGFVFQDFDGSDGNTYRPDMDKPIVGVLLKMSGFDLFDNPFFRIEQTDFEGRYTFANLIPGTYTVTVDLSSVPVSLADENSVDPDGGNDDLMTLQLAAGENLSSQNFGYLPAHSSLGDRVWHDLDGDGIQIETEPGVAGILLNLWTDEDGDTLSDTQVASTTTDIAGIYRFTGLNPNKKYFVEAIVPTATLEIDGSPFTLQNAGDDDTQDSDIDLETGLIGPISLSPGQNNVRTDIGITNSVEITSIPTLIPTTQPIPEPDGPPKLVVNSYNASNDDEVVVLIEAFNVEQLATATISLKYDPTILEPTNCNKDPDGFFDLNQCNIRFAEDEIRFTIIALSDRSGDIPIAEIAFRVIGTDGALSPLTPTFDSASDDQGNPLEMEATPGEFYVFDKRPGDVNCDGVQNSIDALFIMQYDLRFREASDVCGIPARESRKLYEPACDINENGSCDAIDALLILQCNVGSSNIICPDIQRTFDEAETEAQGVTVTPPAEAEKSNTLPTLSEETRDENENNVVYIESARQGSENLIVSVVAEISDGLSTATLDINYDPALLQPIDCEYNLISFGFGLCNPNSEKDGISPDAVSFNVSSPASDVSGIIELATIEFEIVEAGLDMNSALNLQVKSAHNNIGDPVTLVVEERISTLQNFLPLIFK